MSLVTLFILFVCALLIGIAYAVLKLHLSIAEIKADIRKFFRMTSTTIADTALVASPPPPAPVVINVHTTPAPVIVAPPADTSPPVTTITPPVASLPPAPLPIQAIAADAPDANGAIDIPVLSAIKPGFRFLLKGTQILVPAGGSAYECIGINCQNATFALARGWIYREAYPVTFHAAAAAIGAPPYELDESKGAIPNVFTFENSILTPADAIAKYLAEFTAAAQAPVDGGKFVPAQP